MTEHAGRYKDFARALVNAGFTVYTNDHRGHGKIASSLEDIGYPVGSNTKGVLQVYKAYKKAGIKDITCKFYKDGRHEMLNEINKEEVYKDIISWLIKHC